ncbi:MAG: Gfo/Idh/MocA family oxidoreductase [Deltaproteobacteria bacterium]|nr:Gfo/Idh/MocA family oxidoreductase [Deltaproteobacteria bacterium]
MPTSNQPLRAALVGCGRIAQSHLEALAHIPDIKLAAVVDVKSAAAEAVAEQRRCKLLNDYRDPTLLADVDAVILCTPPVTHYAMAKHFLSNGVHVLCEKPLTIASAESQELVELSERAGLKLMMASKFRYVDDIIKAKAIIEAGILGKLILFENAFCSKVLMKDRWNSQRAQAGGGVLIDNGCHSADIARYLLGPIQSVQAEFGISAQGLEVEDTARIQFRTEGGVMGTIDLSWSLNKDSESYISVHGSSGTLHIGWAGSRYRQDGNSNWVSFGTGYQKVAAFKSQLDNFLGWIRGTEVPRITTADALASVRVIEAAYAAATRDNWLAVARAA